MSLVSRVEDILTRMGDCQISVELETLSDNLLQHITTNISKCSNDVLRQVGTYMFGLPSVFPFFENITAGHIPILLKSIVLYLEKSSSEQVTFLDSYLDHLTDLMVMLIQNSSTAKVKERAILSLNYCVQLNCSIPNITDLCQMIYQFILIDTTQKTILAQSYKLIGVLFKHYPSLQTKFNLSDLLSNCVLKLRDSIMNEAKYSASVMSGCFNCLASILTVASDLYTKCAYDYDVQIRETKELKEIVKYVLTIMSDVGKASSYSHQGAAMQLLTVHADLLMPVLLPNMNSFLEKVETFCEHSNTDLRKAAQAAFASLLASVGSRLCEIPELDDDEENDISSILLTHFNVFTLVHRHRSRLLINNEIGSHLKRLVRQSIGWLSGAYLMWSDIGESSIVFQSDRSEVIEYFDTKHASVVTEVEETLSYLKTTVTTSEYPRPSAWGIDFSSMNTITAGIDVIAYSFTNINDNYRDGLLNLMTYFVEKVVSVMFDLPNSYRTKFGTSLSVFFRALTRENNSTIVFRNVFNILYGCIQTDESSFKNQKSMGQTFADILMSEYIVLNSETVDKIFTLLSECIIDLVDNLNLDEDFTELDDVNALDWTRICQLSLFLQQFSKRLIQRGTKEHLVESESVRNSLCVFCESLLTFFLKKGLETMHCKHIFSILLSLLDLSLSRSFFTVNFDGAVIQRVFRNISPAKETFSSMQSLLIHNLPFDVDESAISSLTQLEALPATASQPHGVRKFDDSTVDYLEQFCTSLVQRLDGLDVDVITIAGRFVGCMPAFLLPIDFHIEAFIIAIKLSGRNDLVFLLPKLLVFIQDYVHARYSLGPSRFSLVVDLFRPLYELIYDLISSLIEFVDDPMTFFDGEDNNVDAEVSATRMRHKIKASRISQESILAQQCILIIGSLPHIELSTTAYSVSNLVLPFTLKGGKSEAISFDFGRLVPSLSFALEGTEHHTATFQAVLELTKLFIGGYDVNNSKEHKRFQAFADVFIPMLVRHASLDKEQGTFNLLTSIIRWVVIMNQKSITLHKKRCEESKILLNTLFMLLESPNTLGVASQILSVLFGFSLKQINNASESAYSMLGISDFVQRIIELIRGLNHSAGVTLFSQIFRMLREEERLSVEYVLPIAESCLHLLLPERHVGGDSDMVRTMCRQYLWPIRKCGRIIRHYFNTFSEEQLHAFLVKVFKITQRIQNTYVYLVLREVIPRAERLSVLTNPEIASIIHEAEPLYIAHVLPFVDPIIGEKAMVPFRDIGEQLLYAVVETPSLAKHYSPVFAKCSSLIRTLFVEDDELVLAVVNAVLDLNTADLLSFATVLKDSTAEVIFNVLNRVPFNVKDGKHVRFILKLVEFTKGELPETRLAKYANFDQLQSMGLRDQLMYLKLYVALAPDVFVTTHNSEFYMERYPGLSVLMTTGSLQLLLSNSQSVNIVASILHYCKDQKQRGSPVPHVVAVVGQYLTESDFSIPDGVGVRVINALLEYGDDIELQEAIVSVTGRIAMLEDGLIENARLDDFVNITLKLAKSHFDGEKLKRFTHKLGVYFCLSDCIRPQNSVKLVDAVLSISKLWSESKSPSIIKEFIGYFAWASEAQFSLLYRFGRKFSAKIETLDDTLTLIRDFTNIALESHSNEPLDDARITIRIGKLLYKILEQIDQEILQELAEHIAILMQHIILSKGTSINLAQFDPESSNAENGQQAMGCRYIYMKILICMYERIPCDFWRYKVVPKLGKGPAPPGKDPYAGWVIKRMRTMRSEVDLTQKKTAVGLTGAYVASAAVQLLAASLRTRFTDNQAMLRTKYGEYLFFVNKAKWRVDPRLFIAPFVPFDFDSQTSNFKETSQDYSVISVSTFTINKEAKTASEAQLLHTIEASLSLGLSVEDASQNAPKDMENLMKRYSRTMHVSPFDETTNNLRGDPFTRLDSMKYLLGILDMYQDISNRATVDSPMPEYMACLLDIFKSLDSSALCGIVFILRVLHNRPSQFMPWARQWAPVVLEKFNLVLQMLRVGFTYIQFDTIKLLNLWSHNLKKETKTASAAPNEHYIDTLAHETQTMHSADTGEEEDGATLFTKQDSFQLEILFRRLVEILSKEAVFKSKHTDRYLKLVHTLFGHVRNFFTPNLKVVYSLILFDVENRKRGYTAEHREFIRDKGSVILTSLLRHGFLHHNDTLTDNYQPAVLAQALVNSMTRSKKSPVVRILSRAMALALRNYYLSSYIENTLSLDEIAHVDSALIIIDKDFFDLQLVDNYIEGLKALTRDIKLPYTTAVLECAKFFPALIVSQLPFIVTMLDKNQITFQTRAAQTMYYVLKHLVCCKNNNCLDETALIPFSGFIDDYTYGLPVLLQRQSETYQKTLCQCIPLLFELEVLSSETLLEFIDKKIIPFSSVSPVVQTEAYNAIISLVHHEEIQTKTMHVLLEGCAGTSNKTSVGTKKKILSFFWRAFRDTTPLNLDTTFDVVRITEMLTGIMSLFTNDITATDELIVTFSFLLTTLLRTLKCVDEQRPFTSDLLFLAPDDSDVNLSLSTATFMPAGYVRATQTGAFTQTLDASLFGDENMNTLGMMGRATQETHAAHVTKQIDELSMEMSMPEERKGYSGKQSISRMHKMKKKRKRHMRRVAARDVPKITFSMPQMLIPMLGACFTNPSFAAELLYVLLEPWVSTLAESVITSVNRHTLSAHNTALTSLLETILTQPTTFDLGSKLLCVVMQRIELAVNASTSGLDRDVLDIDIIETNVSSFLHFVDNIMRDKVSSSMSEIICVFEHRLRLFDVFRNSTASEEFIVPLVRHGFGQLNNRVEDCLLSEIQRGVRMYRAGSYLDAIRLLNELLESVESNSTEKSVITHVLLSSCSEMCSWDNLESVSQHALHEGYGTQHMLQALVCSEKIDELRQFVSSLDGGELCFGLPLAYFTGFFAALDSQDVKLEQTVNNLLKPQIVSTIRTSPLASLLLTDLVLFSQQKRGSCTVETLVKRFHSVVAKLPPQQLSFLLHARSMLLSTESYVDHVDDFTLRSEVLQVLSTQSKNQNLAFNLIQQASQTSLADYPDVLKSLALIHYHEFDLCSENSKMIKHIYENAEKPYLKQIAHNALVEATLQSVQSNEDLQRTILTLQGEGVMLNQFIAITALHDALKDTFDGQSMAMLLDLFGNALCAADTKGHSHFPLLFSILENAVIGTRRMEQDDAGAVIDSIVQSMRKITTQIPHWFFLQWLSQIVSHSTNPLICTFLVDILIEVAKTYPVHVQFAINGTRQSYKVTEPFFDGVEFEASPHYICGIDMAAIDQYVNECESIDELKALYENWDCFSSTELYLCQTVMKQAYLGLLLATIRASGKVTSDLTLASFALLDTGLFCMGCLSELFKFGKEALKHYDDIQNLGKLVQTMYQEIIQPKPDVSRLSSVFGAQRANWMVSRAIIDPLRTIIGGILELIEKCNAYIRKQVDNDKFDVVLWRSKPLAQHVNRLRTSAQRLSDLSRKQFPAETTTSISQLSPELMNIAEWNVVDVFNKAKYGPPKERTVRMVQQNVAVQSSIRRPVKITFVLSDYRKVGLLTKHFEDLRLDARLEQLFDVFNSFVPENIRVETYNVVPLTNQVGFIQWVDDCVSFSGIVSSFVKSNQLSDLKTDFSEWRQDLLMAADNINVDDVAPNPNVHTVTLHSVGPAARRAAFEEFVNTRFGTVIRSYYLKKAQTVRQFFAERMLFVQSYSTSCLYGYLLNIADRHLDNTLITSTGRTCPIDFGYSFDMRYRLAVPEFVPFRLTSMLQGMAAPYSTKELMVEVQGSLFEKLQSNRTLINSVFDCFVRNSCFESIKTKLSKVMDITGLNVNSGSLAFDNIDGGKAQQFQTLTNLNAEVFHMKMRGVHPVIVETHYINRIKAFKLDNRWNKLILDDRMFWMGIFGISEDGSKNTIRGDSFVNLYKAALGDFDPYTFSIPALMDQLDLMQKQMSCNHIAEVLVDLASDGAILPTIFEGWKSWV
ncbi:hypothetical protein PCE1_000005 [Barthelona sp. PCE]